MPQPAVEFVRVSLIGAQPVTHISIPRSRFRPSKHRELKSPALDRNGNPRPAKFSPPPEDPGTAPEPEAAQAAPTTGQEATS